MQPSIFIGLTINGEIRKALEAVPSEKLALYVGKEEGVDTLYLEEIESFGHSFLGKRVGNRINLGSIFSFEANIYSILQVIVPDFPFHQHPLNVVLIAGHTAI